VSLVHVRADDPRSPHPGGHEQEDAVSDDDPDDAVVVRTPPTLEAPTPITVLPPLWYRVVTGRVLRWRILRACNRLLWWRRHAARRVLRWTDRHPEIQQMLAREGAISLVVTQLRLRQGPTTRHGIQYRPLVTVDASLDITQCHDQPLVDSVEVTRRGGAAPTRRLWGEAGLIHITPIDPADDVASSGASEDRVMLGAIDVSTWNPTWFRRVPTHDPVVLRQLASAGNKRVTRLRIDKAQRSRAVVCDDNGSHTAVETALAIAELAATGAPLVGPLDDEVAVLLGAALADTVRAVDAETLGDEETRERHSLRLRRLAHREFSPRGTWQRIGTFGGCGVDAIPNVSVLLPSNRPSDVVEAARQVAAQRNVRTQLVVGLHGAHMSDELDDQLADVFSGDLIVRHLSDDLNLGQVLNALTDDADGELVSKWDDDDWYDPWHLNDLVAALEYSGAAMTAKAAEFVYLEALDLTVRRFVTGSERFSTTVAGGTLLLARRELQRLRWADAPRRVDRLLIDALEDAGQSTFRTHGFGYVLNRRGDALGQHTWQVNDSYFLGQSHDQRPGLDLPFAGFERAER